MSRWSGIMLAGFLTASPRAAIEDRATSQFIALQGGAGSGALLGYETSSTFAWTFGPASGKPLHVSYAAAIEGGTASGFGLVMGGRRGRATGYLELSYAMLRTKEQDAEFEREGSTYDTVNGYVPLANGTIRLPAGWMRVSSTAMFIGFNVAPWKLSLAPYAGIGLGVTVMNVSSGWLQGEDGKSLDETKLGMGTHLTLGVRAAPGEEFFGWIEVRPGWHLMSPYHRGADWSKTKDEFVLQLTQILAGFGWQWQ